MHVNGRDGYVDQKSGETGTLSPVSQKVPPRVQGIFYFFTTIYSILKILLQNKFSVIDL